MSKAGELLDPTAVTLWTEPEGDSLSYSPVLAFDGTNYLIVWPDKPRGAQQYEDVHALRVTTDAMAVDSSPLEITTGPNGEGYPAAAFDGTNYLVVWQDSRSGNDDIYAARVDADGTSLDPLGIAISTAGNAQRAPKVAFDGTNYLIVWQDFRNDTDADIYGARVSTAGVLLDPAGIALCTAAHDQRTPVVAFGTTTYLVVWSDGRGGTSDDIYAARVSTDGMPLDAAGIAISSTAVDELAPALAFDGENYLVAWSKLDNASDRDIYAARVSADGAVLDAAGIEVSTAPGDQVTPSVAFDGTNYLVAWEDFRNGSTSDLYAARVTTGGECIDATGIVVSNAVNAQSRPALAYDGTDYLVTWQNGGGTTGDVYAARVSSNGIVREPNGFVISAEKANEAAPAVAFSTDGHALVFYGSSPRPLTGFDGFYGFAWHAKARTVCSNDACDALPDDDAGASDRDDDAGHEEDSEPESGAAGHRGSGHGAAGKGAAGKGAAGNGAATGTDAPAHADSGTPAHDADVGAMHHGARPTHDAGTVDVSDSASNPQGSGCDCSVERAHRSTPPALLLFALLASVRLVVRRRE